MSGPVNYAVVTPAYNEAEHLNALAEALLVQKIRPCAWVIVDNGSSDETATIGSGLAQEHDWITFRSIGRDAATARGGPVVRAFHAGLEDVGADADVVVKLDADITFAPDHFERLLSSFARDPQLGIAAGTCYERDPDGIWRQRHSSGIGIRGACRAYRRECLQTVLPLEERIGWDTIDLVKASVRGWRTAVVEDLAFKHHRREGAREPNGWERWRAQGEASHFMGYRPSYLLLRVSYRAVRQPAAVALLVGYAGARLAGRQRCPDPLVIAFIRRQQSLRRLLHRVRQAVRRRHALSEILT
jgi:glycosyltransferase involved in cell wall biosynthesis